MKAGSRGGDPLSAMYFIAAVLMGVVFLALLVLALLPRGVFSSGGDADVWVPGSGSTYEAPESPSPREEIPAEVREDLHLH